MYRLVIVDDETENLHGLANYFPWDQHGFHVSGIFESAEDAWTFVTESPVDVVLSDVRMDRMDGLQLAQRIKDRYPGIIFVILSAYRDFAYAQQAVALGVHRYVLKPTRHQELANLFDEIRGCLDKSYQPDAVSAIDTELTYGDRMIVKLGHYVENHIDTTSLEDVASFLNRNPSYFSRFFKKQTGRLFSDYLHELRMKKAGEMLLDARYRVIDVCHAVGYTCPKNFAKTFRAYYGISPREFRS